LETLTREVRLCLRSLARRPGFGLTVLLTLALGIGGTTAVFSVLNAALLRPLPFAEGDSLLRVRAGSPSPEGRPLLYSMSDVEYLALRDEPRLFDRVLAGRPGSANLTGNGPAERVSAVEVSPGFWPGLGVHPVMGRHFTAEEERLGPDAGVALLGYGLWQRRFGGSEEILGQAVPIGERAVEVVGVMPPGIAYPDFAELWTPGRFDPGAARSHTLHVVARPRPGLAPRQLAERLDAVAARLEREWPETNRATFVATEPLRRNVLGDREGPALLLMGAVAFLLLIACADVAGLTLARAAGRHQERALRAALGASRARLLRELLVESLLLAAAGGAAGLLLAVLLTDSLARLLPPALSELGLDRPVLDTRVLGFALLVSLATALGFGLAPAIVATRADLRGALQAGGRGIATPGRRLLSGLAVAEVALALVLLFGASQMLEGFLRLTRTDLGLETHGLVTAQIALGDGLAGADERRTFAAALEREIAAIPGVSASGLSTVNPLCCGDWGAVISVEGLERPETAPPLLVHHRLVTPGVFEALGVTLLRGRLLRDTDTRGSEPVVVVDQRLADRYWPDADPIGKRLKRGPGSSDHPWLTVVGVVSAVRDEGDYTETWYLPYAQNPDAPSSDLLHPMLRTPLPAGRLAAQLRAAVARLRPDLAVSEVASMDEIRGREIAGQRLAAQLVAVFGGFGLLLAALGLYGVMSLGTARRRGEIAVRLALGADRRRVVGMLLCDGLALVLAGAALGALASLALARALQALALDGGPLEAAPALLAIGLLGAATLLACWLPARRAGIVDPLVVLRDA